MEENSPIRTDEKKPYETILVVLLIVAAALSGVCGYLSADASDQAGDANDASIRAQNEALNENNLANQQIQEDSNKLIESDVHWVNAVKYENYCSDINISMEEKRSDYEFCWNQYVNAYEAMQYAVGDVDLQFQYLSDQMYWYSNYSISFQTYQTLSAAYNQNSQAAHMEYILAEYLVGNTNAAKNGNISYELYNATDQDPFWANFSAYMNWSYQPYYNLLKESKANATMSEQFDLDAKSYLLSTVMLGVSATIAAIGLSVESRTPRKSLIVVTALVIVVASIYAIMTLM